MTEQFEKPIRVAVVVSNIMLRQKVRAALEPHGIEVVSLPAAVVPERSASEGIAACIIDLDANSESLPLLVEELRRRQFEGTLLGFYSHVCPEVGAAAQKMGVDVVLPRSKFFVQIERLVLGGFSR